MTTAITQEILENPALLYRYTVEEYHQLISAGIIEEGAPYELLDGQVVRKIRGGRENPMTINPQHATAVVRLAKLNTELERRGCHMRTQCPITLPPSDAPEPDGTIARGSDGDYTDHHPTAADILCLIEVADASLRRDRGYKQQLYANAGIPTYLIVNLDQRVVEVYTEPLRGEGRYAKSITLSPSDNLAIPTAASMLSLNAAQLLP